MSLKFLSQYETFDLDGYLKDKELVCTGCSEYKDYDTNAHLGTTVETVIMKDETPYKQKDGLVATNLYRQLSIKVAKDIVVPVNAVVRPVNAKARIYGKYRNELSIKAENVEIIQAQPQSEQQQKSEQQQQLQRSKS